MDFKNVNVKGVKADVAKREITISFTLDFNQLETAIELAQFSDPKNNLGDVEISVSPRQIPLIKKGKWEPAKTLEGLKPTDAERVEFKKGVKA